jgi:hypothetical protein
MKRLFIGRVVFFFFLKLVSLWVGDEEVQFLFGDDKSELSSRQMGL